MGGLIWAHLLHITMAEIVLFLAFMNLFISGAYSSATFTIINNCDQTVWPGILSNAGVAPLSTTGFALQKGESRILNAPSSWGGRFWGRTHCSRDFTGEFSCVTGDCGSGKLECAGGNAAPPATLAEFTLDGHGGMDFYDVSLVDGYNLPMLVVPRGGSGENCSNTGCVADLNGACPLPLKAKSVEGQNVACKSACEAFGDPHYCCSGAYQTPDTCKPSSYSQLFKNACPRAYSYAYDDKTSTFTCAGADYVITFCPSPDTRQKTSSTAGGQNPVAGDGGDDGVASMIDNTMVYEGGPSVSGGSSNRPHAIFGGIVMFVAMWLLIRENCKIGPIILVGM